MTNRLIIGISGASGVIYGIRLLETLALDKTIETHLVLSPAARATITQETAWNVRDVEKLADVAHKPGDIGASIASGSFATLGMIVAPCSIKTLSAIANSYSADLMSRAADVQLKEGRPVLLLVRETPLHIGHLRLMMQAAENGAIIMPPVPAFYGSPQTVDDLVNGTVGRALARIGIHNTLYFEWLGMNGKANPPEE
ncbi:MAG: UbiX family flavin prenyltransferase [Chloroflexi bacterium]|jgi:4-hydroxy-3-polyprenylbenzoate decarboxylase|nr:UbiX family flavin prenyltransferase [Chloroflexota bacterium]MDL1882706.1 UbiX family flavin prenyltransferase [Anaerolineae bacterium CFX8]